MSELQVTRGLVKIATVRDEWFHDVEDPRSTIAELLSGRHGSADLFTFWERLPAGAPRFHYYRESEFVAALPVTTYDAWWKSQVDGKTRNLVRKAEKSGVVVREIPFDDELVQGITRIFNETPVRQGRRFWHYGKAADQVRREMSDRLGISVFLGAYFNGELIGFVKLLVLDRYAMMVEILSEIAHRDKATNNALVAAAVRACADRGIPFLTYSTWGGASVAGFKRNNGFQKTELPRYYVPLSFKGRIALQIGLHRGIRSALPEPVRERLKTLRSRWYERLAVNR